jgi:flagellin
MGFRIATNVSSITARKSLRGIGDNQQNVYAQLATGNRINKSSDDAAGLAISEKLKAQVRSFKQADRNANDGISMIQVAEGGLNEVSNILIRLRELAIQSSSDTVGETERGYTDLEYQQLKSELQRIAEVTTFNGNTLLDGKGDVLEFQVGTKNDDFQDRIVYDVGKINANLDQLGMDGLSVGSKEDAQSSLNAVDAAIDNVSGQRAILGALQNRLITTSSNLQSAVENISAANSRVRDVDYAEATASKVQNDVLSQAGTMVLAQANNSGQNALRLIG